MEKVVIHKADNGWIVHYLGNGQKETTVYSMDSDPLVDFNKSEVDAFVSALWRVTDLIGPETSRYSHSRVVIENKPGDKSGSSPDDLLEDANDD